MDCPTQYNPPPQTRPVWHWVAGGVVVVGALGALAYFANEAQAMQRPNGNGEGAPARRVDVACIPGQTGGTFTVPGRKASGRDPGTYDVIWEWDLSWGDSMQVRAYSVTVGGVEHQIHPWDTVSNFDSGLYEEEKCRIVTDYFRGIGVGK